MITIIIFSIIAGCIIFNEINGFDYYGFFSTIGDLVLSTALGILIGGMIGAAVALALPVELKESKSTVNLINFSDATRINGRFYIAGGRISESDVYSFYYNNNVGIKRHTLPSADATIVYSDGVPRCETYEMVRTKKWYNNFAFDSSEGSLRYVIHIPYGSVAITFSADNE